MTLDDTDKRLIALLREDARASTAELARRLGLSRTTVQSRIERLERSRSITGYTVRLGADFERRLLHAHVMITVRPKLAPTVEAGLRRLPDVRALQAVSGSFDLIALVSTETAKEMDALLDAIGGLDGVERTTSAVVLSTRFDR